jgi:flagellar hook assembly protein FlgD
MNPVQDRRGALLLLALLGLSLGALGFTRALRAEDDLVNSVSVTESFSPGERANIEFTTTEDDERVDVLVIEREGAQVRALQLGEPLDAGTHSFRWDGRADDGDLAPAGTYRLRIILGEAGRDIEPPGPIELTGGPAS